jgi:peptidoglycan glycosyltransferase
VLFARALWIAFVEGPTLSANPLNPRHAQIAAGRGSIVARDGTPLAITRGERRVYPFGSLFAHVVGYASPRYGTAGLLDAYNGVLGARATRENPVTQLTQIAGGTWTPPRGADIVTTLDLDVQRALVDELSAYPRAAGVVLDPRSGAVLALASVPNFDPNALEARFPQLLADARSPLLDRGIAGLYPPGSTFKLFTAAAALDANVVTLDSMFTDPGYMRIGNAVIHDDEGEATGTQNLVGAFARSSNVDFAQVALRLGKDRWFAAAAHFGLGASLDFDLPAERDHLPAPDEVSDSVLAQLGFGQASLLVTPLRMALLTATIADGGVTPRPYLVRRIAGQDTTLATTPEQLATPIDRRTADEVRTMMIAVVRQGTGTAAALPGITVAGKTGTATNPHGASHAWFVAFAPAEAPRVAVAIVIENVGYGGTYAAPIARHILRVALAKERSYVRCEFRTGGPTRCET